MARFFSLSHCNTEADCILPPPGLGPSEDAGVVFRVTCNYSAPWLGTLARGRYICSKGRSWANDRVSRAQRRVSSVVMEHRGLDPSSSVS